VSFISRNHPQQVDKRGALEEVDDRGTTWEVFNPLHTRFRFTLDAAAASHNAKLPRYYTRAENGLLQSWAGERVWCNPPYSRLDYWVRKAWSSEAEIVVMLLPANRTEQKWWQEFIEPYRDRAKTCGYCGAQSWPVGADPAVIQKLTLRMEFLPGRMRFIRPGEQQVNPNDRPPFGVCLAIWERKL
jgi:hypothetical protein